MEFSRCSSSPAPVASPCSVPWPAFIPVPSSRRPIPWYFFKLRPPLSWSFFLRVAPWSSPSSLFLCRRPVPPLAGVKSLFVFLHTTRAQPEFRVPPIRAPLCSSPSCTQVSGSLSGHVHCSDRRSLHSGASSSRATHNKPFVVAAPPASRMIRTSYHHRLLPARDWRLTAHQFAPLRFRAPRLCAPGSS